MKDEVKAFKPDKHSFHPSSFILALIVPASSDDGLEDFYIARAAAQLSAEPGANLALVGVRRALQQTDGGDDHARRADAALRSAAGDEGFLYGVKLVVRSHAFDRPDLCAFDLHDRNEAAIDQHAVNKHGARPALSLAASLFRSRQSQVFAQHVEQARHRVRFKRHLAAID